MQFLKTYAFSQNSISYDMLIVLIFSEPSLNGLFAQAVEKAAGSRVCPLCCAGLRRPQPWQDFQGQAPTSPADHVLGLTLWYFQRTALAYLSPKKQQMYFDLRSSFAVSTVSMSTKNLQQEEW